MSNEPGNLLVVDDNRMNRLLLARSLEHQGHRVVHAENGRQALELLQTLPFDLVLLDVLMPEMDGYQVLAQMMADPHLKQLPVIMVSAVDELDSVVKCIELGADDYLTKPFNPVLLKARIGSSLEKKRLRDHHRELIRKFATDQVAEELLVSGFALGGKLVRATVMFCDIRSFTTLSEAQSPAQDDRAAQRVLRADDGCDRRRERRRQPDDRRRADGRVRSAHAAARPRPARDAGGPPDDRADRRVQPREGGARGGPDPHRHRDRLGRRDRRLRRHGASGHLHLRRGHGEPGGSPGGATPRSSASRS